MANRPKPGKCVHCLLDPVERNWDHVWPTSWYPDVSPTDQFKWRVPSCVACNGELGAIEDEFLRRVALCLDPFDDSSRSVVEKALRGMRPSAAKDVREGRARASVKRRVLEGALVGDAIPTAGIFPGLGEKWGRPRNEQVAVLVPAASFRRLTEKIVRGITYLDGAKFIEPPFIIQFFVLDPAEGWGAIFDRAALRYERRPGVIVRRVVAPEDGISSLFEIEFWGQFKTYACVTRDD